MKKRRIGNDFFEQCQISDNGEIVDLLAVEDTIKLTCKVGNHEFDVKLFEVLANGIIKIEVRTEIYNKLGAYHFNLKYKHFDTSMSDNDRKREVDFKPFQLVAETEQADPTDDIPITVDMATGFEGKSAYEVWLVNNEGSLEDYFNYLRQPASDAAEIAQQLSSHPPKVIDDYWHEWDLETKEYKSTNVRAKGNKGDKGDTPDLSMNIDERGHLVVTINN